MYLCQLESGVHHVVLSLAVNLISNYDPLLQVRPSFREGIEGGQQGRQWYPSQCRPHIPILLPYTHTIGLSCSIWPQHTTRQTDKQSDWNWRKPHQKAFRLKTAAVELSHEMFYFKKNQLLQWESDHRCHAMSVEHCHEEMRIISIAQILTT